MSSKSISAACMLIPACLTMATSSRAASICWIDHVVRAEGGINVYFIQKAVLTIEVKNNSGETSASYVASNGVVRDQEGHERDYLLVGDRVEFHAVQMAHDSCSYKVSSNGQLGKLTAKSVMNLPGLPPVSATQIIGTDGSVSEYRLDEGQ